MDDEKLRRELLVGLQYSYDEEDWVEPLSSALAGVSAEVAHRRPAPDAKGIWDILLHLAVWHENIIERIETGEPTHPPEGAWPAPPSEPTAAAWDAAKDRLFQSLADMKSMLETIPMEKVHASPYGVEDVLCRFIHNGYHIGQIVKMREILGPPLPAED